MLGFQLMESFAAKSSMHMCTVCVYVCACVLCVCTVCVYIYMCTVCVYMCTVCVYVLCVYMCVYVCMYICVLCTRGILSPHMLYFK